MSHELEGRIAAAAAPQHGVITYRQLLQAGASPAAIARRLSSGRMRRLHRGVYLASPYALPHTEEIAAVLASGRGALLSHLSAVRLWRVHDGGGSKEVDVSVEGHRRRQSGIRLHRAQSIPARDRAVQEGIPVTGPARTLLDVARMLSARELEAAVARAEREGLVKLDALRDRLAREPDQGGARALRAVLGLAGGPALTRSVAEEKLLTLVRAAGLPAPRCNVQLGAYEVDFLWPSARLAVEVDGFEHHGSRWHFESDRRRDAALAAQGITVVRLSWRQVTEGAMTTVAQLAQALGRAERR